MEIKGIDVSSFQGSIDWKKVYEDGVRFAIVRAGVGQYASQEDTCFDRNVQGALAAGVASGAYWFSYAYSVETAIQEAQVCMEVLAPYLGKLEYPIYFDYEYASEDYSISVKGVRPTKQLRTDMAAAFCSTLRENGWLSGIYTNLDYIRNRLDMTRLSQYELWLADYSGGPDYACGMQQTGSSGQVAGISGRVDTDLAYKDYPAVVRSGCFNGWRPENTDPGFRSDTVRDMTVYGSYQFRITSTNGQPPKFVIGTAGVFDSVLASQSGSDYFYKVTAIGKTGDQAGVYVNGVKLLVLTVGGVKSDTTGDFTVPDGGTYQFKLTAGAKPILIAGSPCFQVSFAKQEGNNYFFLAKAVGSPGEGSGFYINGSRQPVAIATIV